ncbi:MarR family transcriptional regulator [Paraglaciecola sp.]|uniref:MarR family winged helix-turn-helix transcriptional regulator n=1 Tax=Paraglaciecola sp. TaxID=1920173 RepID=UPI0030F3B4D1
MSALTPAMQLCMAISQVQNQLINSLNSTLSCHGVSFTELMVLYRLALAPNVTLRRIELANSVGLSASGVTRLLAPLEKIGLVQKEVNARDARVSLVKLTEAGQNLLNDALVSFENRASTATANMSEKQLQQSLQLLSVLLPSAS